MRIRRICRARRIRHEPLKSLKHIIWGTYTAKNELGGDQGSPFHGTMDHDELGGYRAEELADSNKQLIGANHEASNLERC